MRTSLAGLLAVSVIAVSAPALAAQRNFPVGNFSEVVLTGSTDVHVKVGGAAAVSATGADADLDRMDIRVEGNRLLIGTKKGSWSWTSRDGVDVYVTVPALTAAIISGSGDMDIDRVSGPFSGRVSGSGDMEVAKVNAPTLNLAISGSGDIGVAAGTCGTGTYATTGSGDIDAGNVRCTTVAATVTGSGDIDGFATGTATLRVTGSGDIEVKGGARCTTSTTGSGTTRCS
ncbi:head GIN domain-containing protein [Sandaracinobacteroides hominis]|uniref:head GIN domain-containing protein n=1 Tax=Sandaracinobacteroides hominis TaxID=2780086 RepID=UPI0018F70F65|nr:head GIN domain-containing protein [Sandaracinobacteroides hominis]